MKALYESYDLLTVMLGIGVVTVIMQSVAGWVMAKLLEDCTQIAGTKNSWIRSLIAKFEICYQLRIPARDAGGFLERYLWEYRRWGIRLSTWGSMGIYGAWLVGMYFGVCTIIGIYSGTTLREYGLYCVYTVVVLSMIFGGELLLQLHSKQKMIRVYLLDYLENTLKPRLENQYFHPEELEEYQREYFDEPTSEDAVAPEEEIAGNWQDALEAAVGEGEGEQKQEKEWKLPTWVEEGLGDNEQKMNPEEQMRLIGEIMEEYM